MRYRVLFVTLTAILLSTELFAQLKNDRLALNIGIHRTSANSDHYPLQGILIDSRFYVEPATLVDLNMTYEIRSPKYLLFPSFGIGFSQKGFKISQVYVVNNYTEHVDHEKYSYLYVPVGINYQTPSFGRFNFLAGQLVVPEILVSPESDYLNDYGLSTRTSVALRYAVNNTFAVRLSPWFQTALTRYNDGSYKPYSFGLSLGVDL